MRTFLVLMVHNEGLQHEEVLRGQSFREAVKVGIINDATMIGSLEDMEDKESDLDVYVDKQIGWVKESYVNGDSDCQVIVYDIAEGIPKRLYPED